MSDDSKNNSDVKASPTMAESLSASAVDNTADNNTVIILYRGSS